MTDHGYAGKQTQKNHDVAFKMTNRDEGTKYIYYGAGECAQEHFGEYCNQYEPVCFCDQTAKAGQTLFGFPVLPPSAMFDTYPGAPIVVMIYGFNKMKVLDFLIHKLGINAERIVSSKSLKKNVHKVNKPQYFSCSQINRSSLIFYDRIDTRRKCVSLCCEGVGDIPAVEICKTGQETIESFLKMYAGVISESKSSDQKRIFTKGCTRCVDYQLGELTNDGLIHYVNLSMYPAPCQCRCIYCGAYINDGVEFDREYVCKSYDIVFDSIDYALKNEIIAPDASWQVSSGEITIHPYKDRILDLVGNKNATFFTNCFKYDVKIGANLAANPLSGINLSIDSGTQETWYKIKGFNNFEEITDNLFKYHKNCSRTGQITLKYILLPSINDNIEDYTSVIEMMKKLDVNSLFLSRDTRIKYSMSEEQRTELIDAAGHFLAMLLKNNMGFTMPHYSASERENAISIASKLLVSGKV